MPDKKKPLTPEEVQENLRDHYIQLNVDDYARRGLTQTAAMEQVARNLASSGKFSLPEARSRVKKIAGGSLAEPTDQPPPAPLTPVPSVNAPSYKPVEYHTEIDRVGNRVLTPGPGPLAPTPGITDMTPGPTPGPTPVSGMTSMAPVSSSPTGYVAPALKQGLLVQAFQLAQTRLKQLANPPATAPYPSSPSSPASPVSYQTVGQDSV